VALELVQDFEQCTLERCAVDHGMCPTCSRNAGLLEASRRSVLELTQKVAAREAHFNIQLLKAEDMVGTVAYLENSREKWKELAILLAADLDDP